MKPGNPPLQSSRLLDQLRERIRYMHYSLSTEKVYAYWVRFFIRWSAQGGRMRHPRDIGAAGIEAFLTMLATERKVSASTHNQALSALLFLYREVLNVDLPWLSDINRPAQKRRIPCVLTKDEVAGLLACLEGPAALIARLLYGTGMRLMEGMRLRIKDVDFAQLVIIVRDAKGGKDRVVMLPRSLVAPLRKQLYAARHQWEADRQAQRGGVEVPHALDAKYPKVGHTWAWFWMFPSPVLSTDPRTGVERRHHLYEDRVQRALKVAVAKAGIPKPVSVHTLHSYATHLIEAGVSLQDVQHILGHHSILTTNRYTHLSTQTEALAAQRIDALMDRFNLGWGAACYRPVCPKSAVGSCRQPPASVACIPPDVFRAVPDRWLPWPEPDPAFAEAR